MQKSCPAYFSFWFFSNNSSDVSPLYGTRYSFYEFIYFSWFSLLLYFRISRLGNATLNLTDSQGWKFMCCSHSQDLCQHASWLLIGCTRVNIGTTHQMPGRQVGATLDHDSNSKVSASVVSGWGARVHLEEMAGRWGAERGRRLMRNSARSSRGGVWTRLRLRQNRVGWLNLM